MIIPPPLESPPPPQSFARDFALLMRNQVRVTWNKWRHRPKSAVIVALVIFLSILIFVAAMSVVAYGALSDMPYELVEGFLSLVFMGGLVGQIFFGITAAFAALYMSEDLELLFVAPVSTKAVFAVKSVSVITSNLITAALFVLLPGLFYGFLFEAGGLFYLLVVLVTLGVLVIGAALAELINLLVMRIVPPHRSKEAIGFIGAVTGILIALMFQIPNWMINSGERFDLSAWIAGNQELLALMNYFPWGWGAKALVAGMGGHHLAGLGWSLLLLLTGVFLFILAFALVERGFRRGFISLSQGEGGRRRKRKAKRKAALEVTLPRAVFSKDASDRRDASPLAAMFAAWQEEERQSASPWWGMWAVAKKDLLYLKRDTREWFGYLAPLIIMAVFIGQYLVIESGSALSSLVAVFIMYTIMFSGNLALQAFGREGEAEWLLNSVPLAGWPVVFGKLLGAVLPTLVLMEALLVGTGVAIGLSTSVIIALAIGAVFLSLGSSAIGLFYSINNCRYNPENPQQRISPGASLMMYLINMVFVFLLAIGVTYLFRPEELVTVLRQLPPVTYEGGILSAIVYGLYLMTKPLLWPAWAGIAMGLAVTVGVWTAIFFGFLAATVRQSRKGLRVEIVTGGKRKTLKRPGIRQ